jgi:hypothetical protein
MKNAIIGKDNVGTALCKGLSGKNKIALTKLLNLIHSWFRLF